MNSVIQRSSSSGPGNGKGGNPRNDRTPSPKPKSEKPCVLYAKGKCDRTDFPYKHDSEAAPVEAGSAKAKATPKGKAKAAAAKAKSAAVVVEINRRNNDGYLFDWSDNDDPSPVAPDKVLRKKSGRHVRKGKAVKIRRNPERINIDVGFDTKRPSKKKQVEKDRTQVCKERVS